MEGFVGSQFESVGSTARKKRSHTRRPRSEPFIGSHDLSLLSIISPSETVSKGDDDKAGYETVGQKKELNMNKHASSVLPIKKGGGEASSESRKNDGELRSAVLKRCTEGSYASANSDSSDKDKGTFELQCRKLDIPAGCERSGERNQMKLSKIKLKVGGVTRTIHTNPTQDGISAGGLLRTKYPCSSDSPRFVQNPISQGNWSDDEKPSLERSNALQGVPFEDLSAKRFSARKDDLSRENMPRDGTSLSWKRTDKSEHVRKSKRVPRRRVLDEAFDDSDEDEEIRYLERVRISKIPTDRNAKNQEIVDGEDVENLGEGSIKESRDGKKNSRSERVSEDTDYRKEEEPASDGEPVKKEMSLTSRQRALLSGKDGGASSIEFPNGLPPPLSRKQKGKLSEVEQQLKKAEAAQRRKMQVEKANKEAQDEAIRKILGQDSGRKKQEDKKKKRLNELAQERAANANTLPPNTIRWVSGPNGNTLAFSNDIGLPSLFDSKPRGYPGPREKCSGPSCTNPYIYRDSKTKLPLCSLRCYKEIHAKEQSASTGYTVWTID